MPASRAALERLDELPRIPLSIAPTPIETLDRLKDALGAPAAVRLLVKRDDAIPFAFGGNKVRKLQIVLADALAQSCDTLITTGGVQSNHARATAAAAARLGLRCVIVANGPAPARATANALLDRLLGAEIQYVSSRAERAPAMDRVANALRARGASPFVIPLGASTPQGAAAYAIAVEEIAGQTDAPDVIVLPVSSGGTMAGVIAGCRLLGVATRVIGISADDPAPVIEHTVRRLLEGLERLLGAPAGLLSAAPVDVDDRFVGGGYGIPTAESTGAIELCARTEALFLDPIYTSKAMAGLAARVRAGEWSAGTILFWHTGGQVGLFAE